uniref:Uncharacterized protein n=1 Tax=Desertifilum tharense IPPAS B-1220 TaxID=1781255 RepID=A0ACD5GRB4_9CYAN
MLIPIEPLGDIEQTWYDGGIVRRKHSIDLNGRHFEIQTSKNRKSLTGMAHKDEGCNRTPQRIS